VKKDFVQTIMNETFILLNRISPLTLKASISICQLMSLVNVTCIPVLFIYKQ